MKRITYLTVVLLACLQLHGQDKGFTKEDTLRGSITPERSWWNLTYYHLDVTVKPEEKFISGHVAVHYKVMSPRQEMQIDLQPHSQLIRSRRMVRISPSLRKGKCIYHHTQESTENWKQRIGCNPVFRKSNCSQESSWQGGFQWTTDKEGNPFVATSCQGLGASAWWPCKDHMYDEPDSVLISVTVPKNLTDILTALRTTTENPDGTKHFIGSCTTLSITTG